MMRAHIINHPEREAASIGCIEVKMQMGVGRDIDRRRNPHINAAILHRLVAQHGGRYRIVPSRRPAAPVFKVVDAGNIGVKSAAVIQGEHLTCGRGRAGGWSDRLRLSHDGHDPKHKYCNATEERFHFQFCWPCKSKDSAVSLCFNWVLLVNACRLSAGANTPSSPSG